MIVNGDFYRHFELLVRILQILQHFIIQASLVSEIYTSGKVLFKIQNRRKIKVCEVKINIKIMLCLVCHLLGDNCFFAPFQTFASAELLPTLIKDHNA